MPPTPEPAVDRVEVGAEVGAEVSAEVSVVVLAGGASRRFGSDKLATPYAGTDLLSAAVAELEPEWPVVLVGPERAVGRPVEIVREDPPGGGPAAALLTGIRATRTPVVITMPGDSPRPAQALAAVLAGLTAYDVVVAADPEPNPLWLGLRGDALAGVRALDPAAWTGRSARALLATLDAVPIEVATEWLADVDRPEDLAHA